jgi:cytochrome c556
MSLRSLAHEIALGMTALVLGCAAPAAHQPPQQQQLARAISAPDRRGTPDHLPEAARQVLRTTMASHARNMADLMAAIMVLDYPRIHTGADAVADDVSLARPLTGEAAELNALLPEEFFRQQDELRESAQGLADAARRMSAHGVAYAYGRLSESCVRCHHVYRASMHNASAR